MRVFLTIIGVIAVFAVAPAVRADMASAMAAYSAGDHKTAFAEMKALAEQGNVDAQKSLAVMYKLGRGVARDLEQAYLWFSVAGRNGYGYAKQDLKLLAKLMTNKQRQRARNMVKNWRPGTATAAKNQSRKGSQIQPQVQAPPQTPKPVFSPVGVSNPDAVAVIIGNKNYGAKTPSVDFAHNDAEAMKRFAIKRLGFREGNVIDLRDATLAQLVAVFGNEKTHEGKLFDWLRPQRSDVLVFYSGHGVPGLKDRRAYLLPVDGDANRAEITGFAVDVLYANLAKTPARKITVYLDACFSGESPKGMLVEAASGISVAVKPPKGTSRLVSLTAARSDQLASWDKEAKHGLFTKHLLEALGGVADTAEYGNGDGEISLLEVETYLEREMSYQARRRYGRRQQASVQGEPATELASLATPTKAAKPAPQVASTPPASLVNPQAETQKIIREL